MKNLKKIMLSVLAVGVIGIGSLVYASDENLPIENGTTAWQNMIEYCRQFGRGSNRGYKTIPERRDMQNRGYMQGRGMCRGFYTNK